jgi:hypothetical protein
MSEERQMLLDTFDAHTHSEVDAADIMSRVAVVARTRRRNRWVVHATGASLAAVGLVAGGIALPGLLSGGPTHARSVTVTAASSGGSADHTRAEDLNAYFDAGYVYADAEKLAKLWNQTNITRVKAEAGEQLLDGKTLPVQPSGDPIPPPNKDVEAFFNAGYDYNDAVTLAGLWHTADAYHAKIKAGKTIENGGSLPIRPSGPSDATTSSSVSGARASKLAAKRMLIISGKKVTAKPGKIFGAASAGNAMSPALTAYFNAGYDYNDAQQLASAWHETDIDHVKAQAGQQLLDGDKLPVPPSGPPAPPTNLAVSTFFADGYDINDAIKLASLWNVSTYHAKIEGGKKLENGESLPIQR